MSRKLSKLHISFGLFRPLLRKDGHMKPYPVLRVDHSGPVMPQASIGVLGCGPSRPRPSTILNSHSLLKAWPG